MSDQTKHTKVHQSASFEVSGSFPLTSMGIKQADKSKPSHKFKI